MYFHRWKNAKGLSMNIDELILLFVGLWLDNKQNDYSDTFNSHFHDFDGSN